MPSQPTHPSSPSSALPPSPVVGPSPSGPGGEDTGETAHRTSTMGKGEGSSPSIRPADLLSPGLGIGLAVAALLGATLSPYIGIASFALFLMLLGLAAKRRRKVHILYMLSAMSLDVGLVLFLELTRAAIETVVGEPLTFLQRLHVGTSLTAMLLYFPTAILGFRLMKAASQREVAFDYRLRRNHRAVALLAFALRFVGFLAMFSMLPRIQTK